MPRALAAALLAALLAAPPAGAQSAAPEWWKPPAGTSFQWQLTGLPVDLRADAQAYDLELFDNEAETVRRLHAAGRKAICYISVGSVEDWRPDARDFPPTVVGRNYDGWPGEKWLDIRRIDLLAPILRARLDMCKAKGFDGVEPDNVDLHNQKTGFPITAVDQLRFNKWLAAEAHQRGLSIGLKNNAEQAEDLVDDFDWALTEECFVQGWCADMRPFVEAGKPVFMVEYTDQITARRFRAAACAHATRLGFHAILKNRELDAFRTGCK